VAGRGVSVAHIHARFADDGAARRAFPRVAGLIKQTILRSAEEPTLYFVQRFCEVDLDPVEGQQECDVVFDEVADGDVESDPSDPWCFHVTVRVKPGGGTVYKRWKVAEGDGQRAARGFIKRTLLRSKADPSVYYYQSFWESEAACQAYSQSDAFTTTLARLDPAASFAEPMVRHDCEIVLDYSARASFSFS
jgi:heme-degrading monooxygenase HmoA